MTRLARAFFNRSALRVAPALLGCRLVHETRVRGKRVRLEGVIVETEAYLGAGRDAASHAFAGPTPRCAAMFGPAGHFYVYRSMGLHWCANLVCDARGRGAAVLLRAVAPVRGVRAMEVLRERAGVELCNGPGKLAQAFGVTSQHDGRAAVTGALRVEASAATARVWEILAGPRVGVRKAVEKRWRFCVAGSAHISRTPQNRALQKFRAR